MRSAAIDPPRQSLFAGRVSQFQFAALLSVVCVAALAVAGYRPYVDEHRGRVRQTIAAFLLIGILALVVFYPVTSFGKAEDIDPAEIWFPSLLIGHVVLTIFLFIWWRLRGDIPLATFLHLSPTQLWVKVQRGLKVGLYGWMLTLAITGAAAGMAATTGRVAEPAEIPPVITWLAELPITYKLIIIAVAMTVEEAFFRSFLQPRLGLVLSSILFACSHFSYGLPFMIVGVFTISLVIGVTFARSGDVLPCIIAHGVFDGIQLLVVLPITVRLWGASPLA